MKLTKLLALGLVTFSLTSCLSDDDDENNETTYQFTDYLNYNLAGTQVTTDDGTTYSVSNASDVSSVTSKLTDMRALSIFSVTYDSSGAMKSGFTILYMYDCFILNSCAKADVPTLARDGFYSFESDKSGLSSKYLNLYCYIGYFGDSIQADDFYLYPTDVTGNTVTLQLSYDPGSEGDTSMQFGYQAVSIDLSTALKSVGYAAGQTVNVILNSSSGTISGEYTVR